MRSAPPGMADQRTWLKWIGIGCAGLALLVIVVVAGILAVVWSLTAAPEAVVREFTAAVAAGDHARAHTYLAAPLREATPLDAFEADVRASPSMFDIVETTFTDRSFDFSEGVRLGGTVTTRAGTTLPASFTLVREQDTWKILAYRIGSTP